MYVCLYVRKHACMGMQACMGMIYVRVCVCGSSLDGAAPLDFCTHAQVIRHGVHVCVYVYVCMYVCMYVSVC